MTGVVVLGASGMLGSMVADSLSRDDRLRVRATVRTREFVERARGRAPEIDWRVLDVDDAEEIELREALADARWVINAVGVIKPYIHEESDSERERALRVNALFPHRLARAAAETGARVVQIATDCVFSGNHGHYTEHDLHDALDAYGKTKSLGEVRASGVHHLRCSIVGPEAKSHVSLLDWFLSQPRDAEVKGFTNHHWNGVTTLHFAKLCAAAVAGAVVPAGVQHVVPSGMVTKADLLLEFAEAFDRRDIRVRRTEADTVVDRSLSTADEAANRSLWQAAGYLEPPSVAEMVRELAAFNYRFGDLGP